MPKKTTAKAAKQPAAPTTTEAPHTPEIVESGGMFVVRCSCGFDSPARSTKEKAEGEAAAHLANGA